MLDAPPSPGSGSRVVASSLSVTAERFRLSFRRGEAAETVLQGQLGGAGNKDRREHVHQSLYVTHMKSAASKHDLAIFQVYLSSAGVKIGDAVSPWVSCALGNATRDVAECTAGGRIRGRTGAKIQSKVIFSLPSCV